MKDHQFAAPVMLQDKTGGIINIGGGVEESPGGGILIKGTVEWENTDKGTVAIYHGKRIESTPDKSISSTGTASTAVPADWDGDGDLDLIVGDIRGRVYLIPNEGTPKASAFGKEIQLVAEGKPVDVSSRAGPCVADWDGDGDLDLLVGADNGSVSLYRNIGSVKSPKLAAAVQLVPPGEANFGPQAAKDARRGQRSKVCVGDWNGDGKPDLLVGDLAVQKPDLPEPTAEEKARYAEIRKELEPISKRYSELIQQLSGPSRAQAKEDRDKASKELGELSRKMSELRSKLPREYDTHGWVWLFLRK
jgi:hypothetical protein